MLRTAGDESEYRGLSEAFCDFESYVAELRSELLAYPHWAEHPDYVNSGGKAMVFRRGIGGEDFAIRLPLPHYDHPLHEKWFSSMYGVPLARTLGMERVEQGVAVGPNAVVSYFVHGAEPYLNRYEPGRVWLFARHVLELMDLAEELAAKRVVRDDGRPENTMSLRSGRFVCVDNIARNNPVRDPVEPVIPQILADLWYSGNIEMTRRQYDEIAALVEEFEGRFPGSGYKHRIECTLKQLIIID